VKCDFCSTTTGVRYSYPARDFRAIAVPDDGPPVTIGESKGGWFACMECHNLVERDARKELADRCLEPFARPTDKHDRTIVAALHAGFFAARKGPAQEVA